MTGWPAQPGTNGANTTNRLTGYPTGDGLSPLASNKKGKRQKPTRGKQKKRRINQIMERGPYMAVALQRSM